MPPKQGSKAQKKGASSSGAAAGKSAQSNDHIQQDPLQAVILADAFSKRLDPLTSSKPACLIPLCNVPLLDWTLENLAIAGVKEIFILSSRYTDQVKKHIASHTFFAYKITVIATPDAQSLGDVMRELDAKQVIRSDFVLIHADTVANLDIASVVHAHKQRRRKDKDAIMTICTMPVGKKSRTHTPGDLSLFFIEPTASQLLHYAPVRAVPRLKSTKLPLELFDHDGAATTNRGSKGAEIDIRNDLVDCGIDICSVDVPPLFSENFDYQTLRRDFVVGILTSDLLDSKIFVHVAPTGPPLMGSAASTSSCPRVVGTCSYGHGYGARVNSTAAYDAVSRDVIAKWTHPLAPSGYLPGGQRYSTRNGLRYVGRDVVLSRTCHFGPNSLLGDRAQIGDKASVEQSVIGEQVQIGAQSMVFGSYIWTNASIGQGCVIERSIVGESVKILDGVKLGHGCIIADGCVVGPNVELPPYTRVSTTKYGAQDHDQDDSDSDSSVNGGESHAITVPATTKELSYSSQLGVQAIGFIWPVLGEKRHRRNNNDKEHEDHDHDDDTSSSDESEDEMDEIERSQNARVMRLATDLEEVEMSDSFSDLSSIQGDDDDDGFTSNDQDDSDRYGSHSATSDSDSDADDPKVVGSVILSLPDGETNAEKAAAEERLNDFRSEAKASLERAFEEGHTIDNAMIELKTLRMASNVPLSEIRKIVISFLLNKCEPEKPKQMTTILDRWGGLIESVAQDDPIETLGFVQTFCATNSNYFNVFVPLLKKFYNDDIVSDESIVEWWKSPVSKKSSEQVGGEKAVALRKAAEEVIRYILENQDSDDDDEEEEEE